MRELQKRLLTIPETGERLRCGRSKVYELVAAGQLVMTKLGRLSRITEESVELLIERLPVANASAVHSAQAQGAITSSRKPS
jgi:excisionase family DNA binding protein